MFVLGVLGRVGRVLSILLFVLRLRERRAIFYHPNHSIDLARSLPIFEADEPKDGLRPDLKYRLREELADVEVNGTAGKNGIQHRKSHQYLINADHDDNPQYEFEESETFAAIQSDQCDYRWSQSENR